MKEVYKEVITDAGGGESAVDCRVERFECTLMRWRRGTMECGCCDEALRDGMDSRKAWQPRIVFAKMSL